MVPDQYIIEHQTTVRASSLYKFSQNLLVAASIDSEIAFAWSILPLFK